MGQFFFSKLFVRFFLALLWIACLEGCGFEPLLSPPTQRGDYTSNLLPLTIDRIPEYSGQKFRQFLTERLIPLPVQEPLYALKVELIDTPQQLGIQKDATTIRMRHVLTASYQLVHKATGKVCHEQTLTTYASYNFVEEQFYSNTVSQTASELHALRTLADLIRLDLAVFLQKQKKEQDQKQAQALMSKQCMPTSAGGGIR
jgi:hypothetical protein